MNIIKRHCLSLPNGRNLLLERCALIDLKEDILKIIENPNEIPFIYRNGSGRDVLIGKVNPKEPKIAEATINNFKLGIDYAAQTDFDAQYYFKIFNSNPCRYHDGVCFLSISLSYLKHHFSLNFNFNVDDGLSYTPLTMEEFSDKELFENMRKFMGPL